MKRAFACLFLLSFVFTAMGAPTPLKCDIGPLHKTYGNTPWLVYACEDSDALVIVSAAGSPAMPFYFTFYMNYDGYHLHGEGTGNKKYTDAAYKDLKALSTSDIKALIKKAKAMKKKNVH